jgi:hypothetical protein
VLVVGAPELVKKNSNAVNVIRVGTHRSPALHAMVEAIEHNRAAVHDFST